MRIAGETLAKRQITHHDGNKGGTGKGDSRPTPTPTTGIVFIMRQADPARAFEDLVAGEKVREARREDKHTTTAGVVNKQMGKEKPDLQEENTTSALKQ
jgi:hypothetical protein